MYRVEHKLGYGNFFKALLISIFEKNKTIDKKISDKLLKFHPNKKFLFTNYGRTAFEMIIEEHNLQGKEIIFPAYICDVFVDFIIKNEIKPKFVDIDKKTFFYDFDKLKQTLTKNTKAILVPSIYGYKPKFKITGKDILLIEDMAHDITRSCGDCSFFSMYKSLPNLSGGFYTSNKNKILSKKKISLFEYARLFYLLSPFYHLINFFKESKYLRSKKSMSNVLDRKYMIPSKAPKLVRAILLANLDNLIENNKKKRDIALSFQYKLKNLGFEVQESENNSFTYLAALSPEDINRDSLIKKLKKVGIECNAFWHNPIITDKKAITQFNINLKEFPTTLYVKEKIIILPLHYNYSRKDVDKIIFKLKNTLENMRA